MSDPAQGLPRDTSDLVKPPRGAAQFRTIFAAVFAAGLAILLVVALLESYGAKSAKADAAREYKMTTGMVTAKGKCNATVGAAYRAAHPSHYGTVDGHETEAEAVVNRCLVDTYGYSPKDIPAGEAIEGIRQHCYAVRC